MARVEVGVAMVRILVGDAQEVLWTLPDESVHCCVTSPPYYGLRDYGVEGQIGLEETVDAYVSRLLEVFREVRRVLRVDGTCWLNLGDSYAGSWGAQGRGVPPSESSTLRVSGGPKIKGLSVVQPSLSRTQILAHPKRTKTGSMEHTPGLRPKNLIGIPWRVAFALQADGWYLRQDIIWHKPNPMPESVRDRCTKAHEYLFLLSKSARYWWDSEAVREKAILGKHSHNRANNFKKAGREPFSRHHDGAETIIYDGARNRRSVWTVASKPYPEAHFATFPPNLIRPCIRAGCPADGTVLDPFAGSGTTGQVAQEEGRDAILIELNPEYCELIRRRTQQEMLNGRD